MLINIKYPNTATVKVFLFKLNESLMNLRKVVTVLEQ